MQLPTKWISSDNQSAGLLQLGILCHPGAQTEYIYRSTKSDFNFQMWLCCAHISYLTILFETFFPTVPNSFSLSVSDGPSVPTWRHGGAREGTVLYHYAHRSVITEMLAHVWQSPLISKALLSRVHHGPHEAGKLKLKVEQMDKCWSTVVVWLGLGGSLENSGNNTLCTEGTSHIKMIVHITWAMWII